MRKVALALSLIAVALGLASATAREEPKIRDVKAPPHLVQRDVTPIPLSTDEDCCGKSSEAKWQLGRAIPKKQFDYGRFHAVVGQDGKTRYFPKLMQHVETARRKAPPPASLDWSTKAPNVIKRMYLNDRLGDCVMASRYHQGGIMSAADGGPAIEADDAEVAAAYRAACGAGDRGCDMSAVNVYQQRVGLKFKGVIHKTDGSVAVDHSNVDLVKAAIAVFGGLNVGIDLPQAWYASNDGADWGPTNSRIVGGHEVQAFGYDDKGVWISTWGGKRRILWAAFTSRQWVTELYATLSPDWYGSDRLAPNGIDATTLAADLQLVANGQIPPLPDPKPPTPPNPVPPGPVPPGPVPPTPPVPPAGPFTGTLVYKDGLLVQVVPGGVPSTHAVESDLKAAGVSPAIILDVIKLIRDLKAKAGVQAIMADLLAIIADLAPAEPKKSDDHNGRREEVPSALAA